MKKGNLILIFLLLFILSAFLSASPVPALTEVQHPRFLGLNSLEKMKPNGEYFIYVLKNDRWVEAGRLTFDKHFRERLIDLGGYLTGNEKANVRIVQKGGGAAHIDSLLLGGEPPTAIKGMDDTLALKKLSRKDYDVVDAYKKDIEVEFSANGRDKVLNLTARVEGERIGNMPFQFPLRNLFRKMNQDSEFYSYTINSGNHSNKPFFKEYSKSGSGHPSGFTYGWVSNDEKNLFVRMDFTPDNTMDGNKDYAIVYVKSSLGLKSFRVSVPEMKWGAPDFTYTDTVSYQHKVYDFRIPFSELGIKETKDGEKLMLAFAAYGTAAPGDYSLDMAFDPANKRYLVIFHRVGEDEVDIYGQFINCDGTPAGPEFIIFDSDIWLSYAKVAYDSDNQRFLVVWQYNNDIYGRLLNADGTPNGSVITIANAQNSQEDPKVTYDSVNDRFLVVWIDRRNYGATATDVYGQLVNANGTLNGSNFIICDNSGFQHSPDVAFDSFHQRFLVAWQDRRSVTNYDIYGRVLNADGTPYGSEFIISDALHDQWSPSISYDSINHRFLTVWHDDRNSAAQISDIYGQIVNGDGSLNGNNFVISDAPNEQFSAKAVFDSLNGRFLVVWQDQRNSSIYSDIYGQFVNADGSLSGINFKIADAPSAGYSYPQTDYNSNAHNFLVAFSTHEGSLYDFAFSLVGPPCRGVVTPTLTEWGMILLAVLFGIASVYYLRRRRLAV